MNSSSEDAIRFAQGEQSSESSTNWYLLLFAVIVTLFAVYWGFVRPTSRQLTKLRRYVTSLESSVADLNVQRLSNGQTVSALERMVEEENATQEALSALREMRDLHRQIVQESQQLDSAREALESLAGLRAQVVRQSSLISSTSDALDSLKALRTQITSSAEETEEAKQAVDKLTLLRDGLIDGINRLDETQPLIDQVQEVQQQIVELAEDAGVTEVAVSQMDNVQSRVQEQMASLIEGIEATEQTATRVEETQARVQQQMSDLMAGSDQTEMTINKVDTLHQRIQGSVAARTDDVATAIETLELATDVKLEMKRAGDTFSTVKRMLSEIALMQPALQQALDSLQPLSELADLRRLGVHELRRVAMNIETRDRALAHSSVNEPLNETIDAETFVKPADPIDQISTEAAEVSLAEIPELTDLSALDTDQLYDASDALLNDLVASDTALTATSTDPSPSLPTPNWTENEIVQAVVKAVSDAAREFTETVEVANANEATVK